MISFLVCLLVLASYFLLKPDPKIVKQRQNFPILDAYGKESKEKPLKKSKQEALKEELEKEINLKEENYYPEKKQNADNGIFVNYAIKFGDEILKTSSYEIKEKTNQTSKQDSDLLSLKKKMLAELDAKLNQKQADKLSIDETNQE